MYHCTQRHQIGMVKLAPSIELLLIVFCLNYKMERGGETDRLSFD